MPKNHGFRKLVPGRVPLRCVECGEFSMGLISDTECGNCGGERVPTKRSDKKQMAIRTSIEYERRQRLRRRCACGTLMNSYNTSKRCAGCAEKEFQASLRKVVRA